MTNTNINLFRRPNVPNLRLPISGDPRSSGLPSQPRGPGDRSSLSQEALTESQQPRGAFVALLNGLGKAATPGQEWEANKKRWQQDLRQVDRAGKTSNSANPLELRELLGYVTPRPTDAPPRHSQSKFATQTRAQETALGNWVVGQKTSLEPADIYAQALKLNGGDSKRAALTAYNMLTNVTSSVRGGKATEDEKARDQKIMNQLVSLRPSDSKLTDEKMGPWYHMFGIGVAAQYGVGGFAAFMSANGPGGDPEKKSIDNLARDSF